MSITERYPAERTKPACEMTPEEWAEEQRRVDAELATVGKPPVRWDLFGQPAPLNEADRDWVQSVAAQMGLKPVRR